MQGPEICRLCRGVRIYSDCDDFHLKPSSLGVKFSSLEVLVVGKSH